MLGGTPIAVWAPNATDGAGTDRRCRFTPHFFQYATEDDMEEARLRTTEVAATVGADAAACVVRLRNLGPSANATIGRGASKFRLSGVYVRRSRSCDEAVTEGWWGLAQNMKHSSGLAKVPEWMMQGKPSTSV